MTDKLHESLMDIVNNEGWEAIDAEIAVWIEVGAFDEQVIERSAQLGYSDSVSLDLRQQNHRIMHADGPYGWEFCARCLNH